MKIYNYSPKVKISKSSSKLIENKFDLKYLTSLVLIKKASFSVENNAF